MVHMPDSLMTFDKTILDRTTWTLNMTQLVEKVINNMSIALKHQLNSNHSADILNAMLGKYREMIQEEVTKFLRSGQTAYIGKIEIEEILKPGSTTDLILLFTSYRDKGHHDLECEFVQRLENGEEPGQLSIDLLRSLGFLTFAKHLKEIQK